MYVPLRGKQYMLWQAQLANVSGLQFRPASLLGVAERYSLTQPLRGARCPSSPAVPRRAWPSVTAEQDLEQAPERRELYDPWGAEAAVGRLSPAKI